MNDLLPVNLLAAIGPISALSAAVGILGVGALYALHHLRIRPKSQTMATLIFWQQTARPQQTRVPWSKRFTHRRTFALLAAIVLLTAAALTADRWGASLDNQTRDVLVIDSGSTMAATESDHRTLLARATNTAAADLPFISGTPALISAGPVPLLISNGTEPAALIRRHLSTLSPQSGASASALAIELAASMQGPKAGRIIWYTAQHQLPEGLPETIAHRVKLRSITPPPSAAIVGVSLTPSLADASRGTLNVTVAGTSRERITVRANTPGAAISEQSILLNDGRALVRFEQVTGGAKAVTITLAGMNAAAPGPATVFQLPDRRPMTFRFVGYVPAPLKAALLAYGQEDDAGEIVVASRNATLPPKTRMAILVDHATTPAEVSLSLPGNIVRPISLEQAHVRAVSSNTMHGEPLLLAGSAAVASLDVEPGRRTLSISDAILSEDTDLPRHAGFPVLIGDWCERLTKRVAMPTAVPWLRIAQDPLWPGSTGSATSTSLTQVADRPDAPVTGKAPTVLEADANATRAVSWPQIVLGGAMALLVVEGLLFAARKIV